VLTRANAKVWTVVLVAAYIAVSVIMWVLAFNLGEDKSRAAMIGAASAFSVGGAAVAGGGFNAWRTGRMEQARKEKEQRQDAYVRMLGALADYTRACADVLHYRNVSENTPPSDKDADRIVALAKEKLVTAQLHASDALLGLRQAFAAVELVATNEVNRAMVSLRARVDESPDGIAMIDDATSSRFVAEARKDLGYNA
jgi:hypothetical protein